MGLFYYTKGNYKCPKIIVQNVWESILYEAFLKIQCGNFGEKWVAHKGRNGMPEKDQVKLANNKVRTTNYRIKWIFKFFLSYLPN